MDYSTILIIGAIAVPIVFGLAFLLRRLDKQTNGNQQNESQKDNQEKK